MTDIPAALRPEIEAVEEAWGEVLKYGNAEAYSLWRSARAALCAKVEALMLRYGDLLGEAPMHFSPESLVRALLNEGTEGRR